MRELPAGTVTFLFTDIEGSTRLLQELGDAYADALAEHRAALRAAFERHGGVEVDTQGDAFFVAFGRATDALAAARDAETALREGPIRVRMGLHTGEPLLTEHGYVGIDGPVRVGEKVWVVPSHCCATVNLHDEIWYGRRGRVEGSWKVAARGMVR